MKAGDLYSNIFVAQFHGLPREKIIAHRMNTQTTLFQPKLLNWKFKKENNIFLK